MSYYNAVYKVNGRDASIWDGQFARLSKDGVPLGGVDWNGQEYSEGDWVLYAVGAGQGQMMAYGKILKIILKERYEDHYEYKVQVLTYRTSGNWDNKKRTRPAYVNPMNITKLSEDQRDILDYGLVQAGIDKNV